MWIIPILILILIGVRMAVVCWKVDEVAVPNGWTDDP